MTPAQIERDMVMLDSLSAWFRLRAQGARIPHSFNDYDVSELLDRAALAVEAQRPKLRVVK